MAGIRYIPETQITHHFQDPFLFELIVSDESTALSTVYGCRGRRRSSTVAVVGPSAPIV